MVQASEVCYTTVCLLKRKLVSCKNFILRENPIGCWFEGTELLGDVPVAFSDLSSPVYVLSLKSSSDVPIDSNRCQSPTNHHDYRYYHRFAIRQILCALTHLWGALMLSSEYRDDPKLQIVFYSGRRLVTLARRTVEVFSMTDQPCRRSFQTAVTSAGLQIRHLR